MIKTFTIFVTMLVKFLFAFALAATRLQMEAKMDLEVLSNVLATTTHELKSYSSPTPPGYGTKGLRKYVVVKLRGRSQRTSSMKRVLSNVNTLIVV